MQHCFMYVPPPPSHLTLPSPHCISHRFPRKFPQLQLHFAFFILHLHLHPIILNSSLHDSLVNVFFSKITDSTTLSLLQKTTSVLLYLSLTLSIPHTIHQPTRNSAERQRHSRAMASNSSDSSNSSREQFFEWDSRANVLASCYAVDTSSMSLNSFHYWTTQGAGMHPHIQLPCNAVLY